MEHHKAQLNDYLFMEPRTWSWIARLMSLIAVCCVLGIAIAGLVSSGFSVGSIIRLADLR